jgi:hypothetical protein
MLTACSSTDNYHKGQTTKLLNLKAAISLFLKKESLG